jgi:hypothetical protein
MGRGYGHRGGKVKGFAIYADESGCFEQRGFSEKARGALDSYPAKLKIAAPM